MLNQQEALDKLNGMTTEEVQSLVCQALDESGIQYEIGTGKGMSLSEFFDGMFKTDC